MRTIVELTEDQIEELRRYCLAEKVSRAEAIRRGVDLLLKDKVERKARLLAALKAAAGSWTSTEDSVDYQRRMRAEWDRDG
jgi:Arc/MetJ-type ribon-helix-helix transcriptional regulator